MLLPPDIEILERDRNRSVVLGHSLSLYCAVNGKPVPTIRWFKDGQFLAATNVSAILPSAEIQGDNLVIKQISSTEFAGSYKCEASNKAGTKVQYLYVDVIGLFICLNTD